MTYERALEVINELHGNQAYTLKEALANMTGLRDELETLIQCLEHDLEQAGM